MSNSQPVQPERRPAGKVNRPRNIVQREAGSVSGGVYIGMYLLLGVFAAAVLGGVTQSLWVSVSALVVSLAVGVVRARAMSKYRREWLAEREG